ncbi:aldo/keto reductase [Streptomyces arenae]|uniref:aldo/keto reductase n=1 Tax=Streptomyces arenae TaxID=29301 RepID=UPI002658B0DD|nr:aldo/keto reductase [Streptomyces arenae]MCG7210068.1 aldo/keto reductase [Streptomyces arenae]
MAQTAITLNNGVKIPQFGLGMYRVKKGDVSETTVRTALELGYRHIDTAHIYGNEASVGKAVRESGIPRNQVWVTSKFFTGDYKDVRAMDKMLERLDTDYVDLVLLHTYSATWQSGWRLLEQALAEGKTRSIGISNFNGKRLEDLLNFATVKPQVLQVESHPYYQQKNLPALIEPAGTAIEGWYPLGRGNRSLLEEPVFAHLGKKYGKSNAQIILRWHIQEGTIIFPSSTNPEHLAQNIDIFDFELTDEEMNQVRAMDKNQYLNGFGKHE